MTTQISTEGNLTADPTVRYTTNGKPVATLRIAVSDRRRKGEEYADTVTVFYDVEVWGKPAEHAANTFRKGDRITVTGQHYLRPWTDQAGDKRTTHTIDRVTSLGASLQYATAVLAKATRTTASDAPVDEEPPFDPYDS